ncbi:cupredoxin domain-containing protein [Nesterenkonia sp. K-15-9-6]|uniref:cupredoxin domain-containing protein n=1 Tax=Nesterenkonia sp. K-15-9-6 TaxID=3093918 RepID=UPI004044BDB1
MRPHLRRTPAQPGRRRTSTTLAVLAAAGLLLVGCQGDEPTDDHGTEEEADSPRPGYGAPREAEEETDGADDGDSAATPVHLTITDHEFDVPDTVAPGAEITVTNHDGEAHTVTSDESGIFDVAVGAGETVTFAAPEEPGDYSLHCTPHPFMTATLVVE